MTQQYYFSGSLPALIVHGGAGRFDPAAELAQQRDAWLQGLADRLWPRLRSGAPALEVAYSALSELEASGLFNAGRGAALQRDGLARLSAAVMDGERQKFSGVQLVTHLSQPSRLAFALQEEDESVLGPFGAQLLARRLGIPPQIPFSSLQARRWLEQHEAGSGGEREGGTVGVVVLDQEGRLAAATSTGGGRGNGPERMSDSATVAGTYASRHAAISCTGIGEEIVDDALAARLETRIREGRSLCDCCECMLQEAGERSRCYGWIALDRYGNGACCATDQMHWAARLSELSSPGAGSSRGQS